MIDLIGQALSLLAWAVYTGLAARGLISLLVRDPNPNRLPGLDGPGASGQCGREF